FSSRRRHTRFSRDWSFRRVLFRSAVARLESTGFGRPAEAGTVPRVSQPPFQHRRPPGRRYPPGQGPVNFGPPPGRYPQHAAPPVRDQYPPQPDPYPAQQPYAQRDGYESQQRYAPRDGYESHQRYAPQRDRYEPEREPSSESYSGAS